MTTAAFGTPSDAAAAAPEATLDAARGWYLYGITRGGSLAPLLAEVPVDQQPGGRTAGARDEGAPLQLLEAEGLAAVIRSVPLSEFTPELLQERLRSDAALEEMVRSHNHVIHVIHRRQAILPAKFGSVYVRAEEVASALRAAREDLLRKLDRVEGSDEWAVHLYADRAVVRQHVAGKATAIQELREQRAAARPGRAYFLERQLRDELEDATQQALVTIAQEALDRLARTALAALVSPVGQSADAADEVEILRAAFLVARGRAQDFQAEVGVSASARDGLRTECTGPWPPYSFTGRIDEEAQ